jgi:hypothetical protein
MQRTDNNSDDNALNWLLEEDQPVPRFYALTELLELPRNDPVVLEAARMLPSRGWAERILAGQNADGSWQKADDLYRPKYVATNWKSIVLSDFGLTKEDPRIAKTGRLFFDQWLDTQKENIFHDEVCIVGNTARMLARLGFSDDPRVEKMYDRLIEDQKEDGGLALLRIKDRNARLLGGASGVRGASSLETKPKDNKFY